MVFEDCDMGRDKALMPEYVVYGKGVQWGKEEANNC